MFYSNPLTQIKKPVKLIYLFVIYFIFQKPKFVYRKFRIKYFVVFLDVISTVINKDYQFSNAHKQINCELHHAKGPMRVREWCAVRGIGSSAHAALWSSLYLCQLCSSLEISRPAHQWLRAIHSRYYRIHHWFWACKPEIDIIELTHHVQRS